MESVIDQSFKINLAVMHFIGLYSHENDTIWKKTQAYIFYFLCIIPMPVLGILYLLYGKEIDLERMYDNAFLLADMTCYITKLLPFIKNSDKLKICLKALKSPHFAVLNREEMAIITECTKICKRNSRIFFIVVLGGISVWATKPLFWKHYNLPIDIWIPFTMTTGSLLNCSIYLFLVVGNKVHSLYVRVHVGNIAYCCRSILRLICKCCN
jgi:hypothetical protein